MSTEDKVVSAFGTGKVGFAVRGAMVIAVAVIGIPNLSIVVSNFRSALDRNRQKRTMASMRDAATRHEAGKTMGTLVDGWGHPMRVRIRGPHYSIRSAAAGGAFETGRPRGSVDPNDFTSDLLFADGEFLQLPGGIAGGDLSPDGLADPTAGACSSCHPQGVAKAIGSPRHGTREADHPHR